MIIITGVPGSGKTTLSNSARFDGLKVFHSDDLSGEEWSDQSDMACIMMQERAYDVMEGVIMVRALRKLIERSMVIPVDTVIWMPNPIITLSHGQSSMAKGCIKVWNEIHQKLIIYGVKTEVIK